jgi:hypothetical protein
MQLAVQAVNIISVLCHETVQHTVTLDLSAYTIRYTRLVP